MASTRPHRIDTEHFHAVYSLLEQGYICLFICGRCGRRGKTVVRDLVVRDLDGPRVTASAAVPDGWDANAKGPEGEALPRCDTCIAGRADAVAAELLRIA